MTTTVTIGNATINSEDMYNFLQRSRNILEEVELQNDAFKNLVKEIVDATKLDKKVVSKFLKSRYKFKTKEIVAEAETLDALSKAVDE
jgi:hypothetical protein